tara:strand:- start:13102 stop:13617 length:516 start_codon:yes stop_codon:yes gene_type:complete
MKLVGKKITRVSKEDLNTKAQITVDPVKGSMKISPYALRKLDCKYVGFAYDDESDPNKVYMYKTEVLEGCKVADNGSLNSRWHSRELRNRFSEGKVEKFTLDIVLTPHEDEEFEGISFYEVTWKGEKEVVVVKNTPVAEQDLTEDHPPTEADNFVQEEAWAHEEEKDNFDF